MANSIMFAENYVCPQCTSAYGINQMLYLDETTKVLRCPTHPNYSRALDSRAQLVRYEDVDGLLIRPYVPPGQQGGGVGPQGPKGDKGDKGDPGVAGPKGDTGAKGETGAQGAKGDAGAAGAKGDQGLKGDTGAAGAKGDAGTQGIQGVKGDTGATGTAGAKGDKGDTGSAGAKGDAGKSVTAIALTVDGDGKVTSGEATFSDSTKAAITVTTA